MGFREGLADRSGITAHIAQNGLGQQKKTSLGFLGTNQFLNIAGLPMCMWVPSQVKGFGLLFFCSSEALLRISINDSKVHQALNSIFRGMMTTGMHRVLDLSPANISCNER